jgi:hypothetical protein
MDFVSFLAPLFGIAFLVERILEGVWNIVEMTGSVQKMKADPAGNYGRFKQIVSVVVGIIIAVVASSAVKLTMFSRFGITGLDANTDALISGAIAGALAPYAHQILEALLNFQKLLQAQKERIENPPAPQNPPTG